MSQKAYGHCFANKCNCGYFFKNEYLLHQYEIYALFCFHSLLCTQNFPLQSQIILLSFKTHLKGQTPHVYYQLHTVDRKMTNVKTCVLELMK